MLTSFDEIRLPRSPEAHGHTASETGILLEGQRPSLGRPSRRSLCEKPSLQYPFVIHRAFRLRPTSTPMAPVSFLSFTIHHPILSQPSGSPSGYLPFVGIAAVMLLLIVCCGDNDAPVGPRRRNISYESWFGHGMSAHVAAGEHESSSGLALARVQTPTWPVAPSPTEPPPYSRHAPFPY
ncbi:hypothetical protein BD309DRAFT_968916 [Dichomitus squalens]|nr:hypothetical protein BD309DRAFT_968916 [Dichomitus squalens]